MKKTIKKITAIAMAFTLLFTGTAITKSINPESVNIGITAEAAVCRHTGYSHWYTYEWYTYKTEDIMGAVFVMGAPMPAVVGHKQYQRQYRYEYCAKCGARIDVKRTGKERVI